LGEAVQRVYIGVSELSEVPMRGRKFRRKEIRTREPLVGRMLKDLMIIGSSDLVPEVPMNIKFVSREPLIRIIEKPPMQIGSCDGSLFSPKRQILR
jgi:hypothetical protein